MHDIATRLGQNVASKPVAAGSSPAGRANVLLTTHAKVQARGDEMESLTPARIMEVGMAFWPAKVLLSAIELGLFTELGAGAMTGRELQDAPRPAPACRTPTSSTRWSRSASSTVTATARRRATATRAETAAFLDRQQPAVHGRLPRDGQRAALPLLGRSDRGAAHRPAAERDQAHRRVHVRRAVQQARAARAVHGRDGGISAGNFQAFAEKFDFSRYQHPLRRGRRHRPAVHVRGRSAPAHAVRLRGPAGRHAIAQRKIAAAGLADRVSARPLDFFADPLPKADVITMGMILHDWNLEKKMHLIRRPTTPCLRAARSSSSRTSSTMRGARTPSG